MYACMLQKICGYACMISYDLLVPGPKWLDLVLSGYACMISYDLPVPGPEWLDLVLSGCHAEGQS